MGKTFILDRKFFLVAVDSLLGKRVRVKKPIEIYRGVCWYTSLELWTLHEVHLNDDGNVDCVLRARDMSGQTHIRQVPSTSIEEVL